MEIIVEFGLKYSSTTQSSLISTSQSKHNSLYRQSSNYVFQQFLFIGYCTMHGVLYLLQSFDFDCLTGLVIYISGYIMDELQKMQRSADILTDW